MHPSAPHKQGVPRGLRWLIAALVLALMVLLLGIVRCYSPSPSTLLSTGRGGGGGPAAAAGVGVSGGGGGGGLRGSGGDVPLAPRGDSAAVISAAKLTTRHSDGDDAAVAEDADPAVARLRYRVVVFTYLRPDGLARLLRSLNDSHYPRGATIALSVLVDFPKERKHADPAAAAARAETLALVRGLRWPHGPLTVHRRQGNVGLKRNILEAWYPPADDGELGVTLEDDIEVSPFWFEWVLAAVGRYYLGADVAPALRDRLLGVSLFRPVHDELSRRACEVRNGDAPFLLQQPCSWGAVFFPRAWRNFRDWYDAFDATGADPVVVTEHGERPDSNTWARSSSWKKYLIMHMHEQGWAMVYPNLPRRLVLSTNHLMKGEHPLPNRKLFELPLLGEAEAAELWPGRGGGGRRRPLFAAAELPPLSSLRGFDVMFNEVAGGAAELLKPRVNAPDS